MLLVTTTEALSSTVGLKESIEIIKKAGFDAIDISFFDMTHDDNPFCREDYMNYAEEILKTAKENNIRFVQAHAPFPVSSYDEEYSSKMFKRVVRSMKIASFLGVKIIVVHPPKHIKHTYASREKIKNEVVDFYKRLIPYCEKYNIKIATENMFNFDTKRNCKAKSVNSSSEEFIDIVDSVGSKWVGACLDLGHCGLTGEEAYDMIRALGKRIICLHIHDNDYKDDSHNLPYLGDMDWEEIISALDDIDYRGNFTFEVLSFISAFPPELALDAEILMQKVGRHLMKKLKNK